MRANPPGVRLFFDFARAELRAQLLGGCEFGAGLGKIGHGVDVDARHGEMGIRALRHAAFGFIEIAARLHPRGRGFFVAIQADAQLFQGRISLRQRKLAQRFVVHAALIHSVLQADLRHAPIEMAQGRIGAGAIGAENLVGFRDVLRWPIDARWRLGLDVCYAGRLGRRAFERRLRNLLAFPRRACRGRSLRVQGLPTLPRERRADP